MLRVLRFVLRFRLCKFGHVFVAHARVVRFMHAFCFDMVVLVFLLFCLLLHLSRSCPSFFLCFVYSFRFPLVILLLCFGGFLGRICVTLVFYGRFGESDCRRSLVC